MNTCRCSARFEEDPARTVCPGCDLPLAGDPAAIEEPLVEFDGRRMPQSRWESEFLVNTAGWLAFLHAIPFAILEFGTALRLHFGSCGPKYSEFGGVLDVLPFSILFSILLGAFIRARRGIGTFIFALLLCPGSYFCCCAWYPLGAAYIDYELPDLIEPVITRAMQRLPLPPPVSKWLFQFPWAMIAAFMLYSLVRASARRVFRPCYRRVRLAPVWSSEPKGTGSLRLMIARVMILLAGLWGTTVAGYLAWFFYATRLD